MENTRYYSFKIRIPCSYVLPFIYLSADDGESVYIITPWINVDMLLPQIHLVMNSTKIDSRLTLMEFLKIMREYKSIDTIVILKDKNEFSNSWSYPKLTKEGFKVYIDPKIHIKAILSPKWVYTGSANITDHGLYENKENCEIGIATGSPEEYLKEWRILL